MHVVQVLALSIALGVAVAAAPEPARLDTHIRWPRPSRNRWSGRKTQRGGNAGAVGTFLHVTDVHIDPKYLNGTDPQQSCHRANSTAIEQNTAGFFGTVGSACDSPTPLVDATFQFLADNSETKDADFIIYTGDTARHDRDKKMPRTNDEVLSAHQTLVDYFAKTFDLAKVTVYPTFGNNDAFGHDAMGPNSTSLISNLTQIWDAYGLDLGTDPDFQNGGYYIRQIRDTPVHVISLNSFWYYDFNTLTTDCNVTGSMGAAQNEWLAGQLDGLRSQGGRAYVIQHIPPRDLAGHMLYYEHCYADYLNVTVEYADVIETHFHGHTNDDYLSVVTKDAGGALDVKVINGTAPEWYTAAVESEVVAAFTNGPSIIPANNPAVRVYYYDMAQDKYGRLIDYRQFFTDIAADNKNGAVKWESEYSASQAYGMKDLSLDSWKTMIEGLAAPNSSTFAAYKTYITAGYSGPEH
ncbi:Endopolyphosphatase [Irineochytrium annulatum]|nr:Endopolyphosphatase [Irineochytrium annulatum]